MNAMNGERGSHHFIEYLGTKSGFGGSIPSKMNCGIGSTPILCGSMSSPMGIFLLHFSPNLICVTEDHKLGTGSMKI
jgi:hypothetical protein